MFYFFIAVQFLFHFGNGLAQVQAGTVQDAESLLQFPAYFFGIPARERPTLFSPMQRAG
jgi:hypothetical protein